MMPYEPVVDVMRRTMYNLRYIEAHQNPDGPYEVTQLLNSFLGALAHPLERYRNDLCNRLLNEAARAGWPKVDKERPNDRDPESLGDLLQLMRNAIAHGNVEFLPGPMGDIRAVRLWNKDRGRRTWGTLITVRDMRTFLECWVQLAEELCTEQIRSRPQIA